MRKEAITKAQARKAVSATRKVLAAEIRPIVEDLSDVMVAQTVRFGRTAHTNATNSVLMAVAIRAQRHKLSPVYGMHNKEWRELALATVQNGMTPESRQKLSLLVARDLTEIAFRLNMKA